MSLPRLHSLDKLRAVAMFLGLGLHASLSFQTRPLPHFVHDVSPTPWADWLNGTVHGFRMELFFFLAGLFGCLLAEKYGLRQMFVNRIRRIGIPLAVGILVLQPVLLAICWTGPSHVWPGFRLPPAPPGSAFEVFAAYFTTGEFLAHLKTLQSHIWFLYFLVIFDAAAVPLWAGCLRFAETGPGRALAGFCRWTLTSPAKLVVVPVLALPAVLMMRTPGQLDWALQLRPSLAILAYYFAFFAVGWAAFRVRDRWPEMTRGWPVILAAGLMLSGPVLHALHQPDLPSKGSAGHVWGLRLAGLFAAWWTSLGLFGLFWNCLRSESRTGRYLADSSYWCYLFGVVPIALLQIAWADWAVGGELKLALIIAATFAVSLLTYEVFVRYTLIGAVLNGRKVRPGREPMVYGARPSPVVAEPARPLTEAAVRVD